MAGQSIVGYIDQLLDVVVLETCNDEGCQLHNVECLQPVKDLSFRTRWLPHSTL